MSKRDHRLRVRDLPTIRDSIAHGTVMPAPTGGLFARPEFTQADSMWWVSADMTSVALAAAEDIPAWSHAQARPGDTGVLIWSGGTGITIDTEATGTTGMTALGVPKRQRVQVDGVAWHLHGTDMMILLLSRAPQVEYDNRPPLVLVEVALIRGADADLVYGPEGAAEVVALLGSTWLLAGQPRIAESRDIKPRSRGGGSRRGGGVDVRVVDVRARQHATNGEQGEGSREYRHRWIVRGHWRQQACGPGWSERKPVFVPAHIKGPDDAPFRRDEVRVIRK